MGGDSSAPATDIQSCWKAGWLDLSGSERIGKANKRSPIFLTPHSNTSDLVTNLVTEAMLVTRFEVASRFEVNTNFFINLVPSVPQ